MRGNWRNRIVAVCLALGVLSGAGPVSAQEAMIVRSPVLTIDSERLYSDSLFGKRVQNEIEAAVAVLEAENREIEAQLIEEEQQLTEKRPTMAPEDFRVLADEFDAKVQRIRVERAGKLHELAQRREQAQRLFLQSVTSVLEKIMTEAGAAVIVESRSVFLSARIIDVTTDAVARIDAEIGDGSDLEQPEQ